MAAPYRVCRKRDKQNKLNMCFLLKHNFGECLAHVFGLHIQLGAGDYKMKQIPPRLVDEVLNRKKKLKKEKLKGEGICYNEIS